MRRHKLIVAVPASLVSDVPHLREKTLKIGLVGRAAAIFRVDEIVVFPDFPRADQRRDTNLIATVLAYMETPQYLRKRLFKIRPELRYVGILPPLRTPHHPLAYRLEDLKIGEFREGVVVSSAKEGVLVDIGVEQAVLVPDVRLGGNKRVTVKLMELEKSPKAVLAKREEVKAYWGYHVAVSKWPFGKLVKSQNFDLVVATSRRGKPFKAVRAELEARWRKSRKGLVAFGAPTGGLYEIAEREGKQLEEIAQFVVNTIPNQATETVRTEEAIYATLAILNTLT
jgi:predicted SPOUT superfamily RNA methylase MTH1